LGRIEVNIVDETSTPLPGVLVSLSGKNFRQNNITSREPLNFYSLRPNQYFLRPLLKEYTFEPATLSVALSSGQQSETSFKAKRVAFSLHGRVSSLNGMSLSDVTVEARSGDVVEESKSDEEGAFRIRGLFPGKTYQVKVKAESQENQVLRTLPASVQVDVTREEVRDVNFTIYRYDNTHDISGSVSDTSVKRVSLLRNTDTMAHYEVGPTLFFNFRGIPSGFYFVEMLHKNGQKYQQRLELNKNVHLQLDPEFTHGEHLETGNTSFAAIFFVLAVIFFAANYNTIVNLPKRFGAQEQPKDNSWLPKGINKRK